MIQQSIDMTQKTLRQLAKSRAQGIINKEDYRQARSELIEDIISGKLPLQENKYLPFDEPKSLDSTFEEVTERKTGKRNSIEATSTSAAPTPTPPAEQIKPDITTVLSPKIISATAGVIVISILLIFMFTGGNEDTSSNIVNEQEINESVEKTAGQKLIQSFLRERSWNSQTINTFLINWSVLSEIDKTTTLDTIEMGQLSNAIYKQLLEERALSGISSGEQALEKQRLLVNFAHELGIQDERINLPNNTIEEIMPDEGIEQEDTVESETEIDLSAESNSSCQPSSGHETYCRDFISITGNYGPTMIIIPAGSFIMGGDMEMEQPIHTVSIDYSFAISVHEITYGEFIDFCQTTNLSCPHQPWFGKDYPVVNVSWDQAVAYTHWLTESTGNQYRLPSEAEWEYVARAGDNSPYPSGEFLSIHDAVFSGDKTLQGPLPKTDRSINRNKFQVYHMNGNIREWTLDRWQNDYKNASTNGQPRLEGEPDARVVRGGSYADNQIALRMSARTKLKTNTMDRYTGFRIVQELNNS